MRFFFMVMCAIMALTVAQEPSGIRYIRSIANCNTACASATPIASVAKCCSNNHAGGFGFCSKNNQAICATKDETYIHIGK